MSVDQDRGVIGFRTGIERSGKPTIIGYPFFRALLKREYQVPDQHLFLGSKKSHYAVTYVKLQEDKKMRRVSRGAALETITGIFINCDY